MTLDDINMVAGAIVATCAFATLIGGGLAWVINRNQKRRAATAAAINAVRSNVEGQLREVRAEFQRELAEHKNDAVTFATRVDSYFQTLRAECATRTEIERIGQEVGRVHARIDDLFKLQTKPKD